MDSGLFDKNITRQRVNHFKDGLFRNLGPNWTVGLTDSELDPAAESLWIPASSAPSLELVEGLASGPLRVGNHFRLLRNWNEIFSSIKIVEYFS